MPRSPVKHKRNAGSGADRRRLGAKHESTAISPRSFNGIELIKGFRMDRTVDFKIWSRLSPDEDFRLPRINACELELIENREASVEEIPAEILLTVGGLTWLIHFRLTMSEGDGALPYAEKFARRIAEELEGVLEQTGAVTAICTEKPVLPAFNEYTPMLTLSVWFEGGFTDELYDKLLSVLERDLPLALPSRYGDKLPPDREYSGRAELLDFLGNTPAPVWYAHMPVTHVIINDAERAEAGREGLRTDRISIRMPDALYELPEWRFALKRTLKELTLACGGFFGQLCRGESGVVSWWWRGVPLELGVACTFGEPYCSLIPDCAAKGERIGESFAYFEEPNGPYVPTELVSMPKKRSAGRTRLYPDDFSIAPTLPIKGARGADEGNK